MKLYQYILLILISSLYFFSCKKEEKITEPTVTTIEVTEISTNSARCGGNISDDGGAKITARGVCWSATVNPTITNSHTSDGNGIGSFASNITGLTANTTYYLRAYATNSKGTAYGEQRTFITTSTTSGLATVTTNTISNITGTTATCGGNATADGGNTVTAKGVCWSTNQNPTIANSKTTDGQGLGVFTSSITGITSGTTYYVRSYATNSSGTSYGEQKSFTTTCYLTFNSNGGSGTMANQSFAANVSQILSANTFTRTGYTFASWNTNSDGTGTNYSNQQSITISSNFTLYAKWSALATYTVTFNSNGGSGTMANQPFYQRVAQNLSANTFTKTGYTFSGWNTNSAGTGTSYTNQQSITISLNTILYAQWNISCPATVTDCQGNIYNVIGIGTQCWTKQNMKATKYDTNSERPNIILNTSYSRIWTPYYQSSTLSHPDKGLLYNWAAAVALTDGQIQSGEFSGKRQGICPNGWHVPTDAEWSTLENYLGGSLVAGGKMKTTGTSVWNSPNTGATNSSGFSALPSGEAGGSTLFYVGSKAYFWSSSAFAVMEAYCRGLDHMEESVARGAYVFNGKFECYSVRCIKN